MIYRDRTNCLTFFIGLLFFSACTPRPQKAFQRIYIATNKNVKVIAVEGDAPASSPDKSDLSCKDLQSLTPKKLYVTAKRLYKAEKKTGNPDEKISNIYFVPRSSKPVAIKLSIDSTQRTVYLAPHKNYGRFLNMRYVFTLRDSLDLLAYKRWIYPKRNVITVADAGISISRFAPVKKGTVYSTISPGIQIFNLKKDNGQYNSAGILGAEIGVDYFYRENRFLSFNIGAATDVGPLPIEYFGPGYIERGSAIYTSVRNNIVKGSFDIGYGVSLSRLYWTSMPVNYTVNAPESKVRTTGAGLSFSAHYMVKKNFRAGMLYQPNLVNINYSPLFTYQHFAAIQFTWSLGGRRKSRQE